MIFNKLLSNSLIKEEKQKYNKIVAKVMSEENHRLGLRTITSFKFYYIRPHMD